ncbi:hypothetical protein Dimus_033138 [Dionaea muscipula]
MAQRSSVSESIRGSQSRVSVDLKGLEQEKLGDLPCVAEGLGKLESDLPPKVTMEEVDAQQTERSALSSGFGRPYLKALKVGTGGESALEDSGSPVADEDAESPASKKDHHPTTSDGEEVGSGRETRSKHRVCVTKIRRLTARIPRRQAAANSNGQRRQHQPRAVAPMAALTKPPDLRMAEDVRR